MMNILVSGAGTATCQAVIKGLAGLRDRLAVCVHTMDLDEASAGRFLADRFHRVPAAADERFIPVLLEIVKRERIELLIPIVDYEFAKLAAAKVDFRQAGCRVVIVDPPTLEICNNKLATSRFFGDVGLSAPATESLSPSGPRPGKPPWIIKPVYGRASLDVYRIDTEEELDYHLRRVSSPMLIQEYVVGQEVTVDFLCDFSGNLVGMVPRERVEVKSGLSYKGRTFRDPVLARYIERLVTRLDYVGPGNVQCMRVGDDYTFIEINPRFSGGLPLTLAAGMNSPAMLVDMLLGNEVTYRPDSHADDLYMLRYWEEVFERGDTIRSGRPHTGRVRQVLRAVRPACETVLGHEPAVATDVLGAKTREDQHHGDPQAVGVA